MTLAAAILAAALAFLLGLWLGLQGGALVMARRIRVIAERSRL